MSFQKATKKKARLRLGLIGPSGSGKTFTALSIAKHLGAKVAVIDTERGSASKYADDVADFDVAELTNFAPARYIEKLNEAATAGYDVIVVDSLSHAWMGVGGIIDQKDKKGSAGFDAWRTLTPQHNDLVEAILASPCHIIVTMRSKTEYIVEKNAAGKSVPRKIGTAPVQRDGMEYEFDVVGELDADHTMHVSKSRCSAIEGEYIRKPGKGVADALLSWLGQGVDAPPPPPPPPADPMVKVLEHARAIFNAETEADVVALFSAIDDAAGDSLKMRFALESACEARTAQLADVEWTGDDKRKAAVAWLRSKLE